MLVKIESFQAREGWKKWKIAKFGPKILPKMVVKWNGVKFELKIGHKMGDQ